MATTETNNQIKTDLILSVQDIKLETETAEPVLVKINSHEENKDEAQEKKDLVFTEVSLDTSQKINKNTKVPRRILHFSDGVLEEYSTDDGEEVEDVTDSTALLDTKQMAWIPYLWYLAWWMGSRTLAGCDFLGEKLAYFFGITSPKYQYELEEYQKMLEEKEEEKKIEDIENVGWKQMEEQLSSIEVKPPGKNSLANEQSLVGPNVLSGDGGDIQMTTRSATTGIKSQLSDDTFLTTYDTEPNMVENGSVTSTTNDLAQQSRDTSETSEVNIQPQDWERF
ncbi:uncharacterized protein LOC106474211 [Limulus polyphemus]|uniref:Uncharacterized protein LOC106474211 n=1 Tax=Limulus polyphemus TaxID=6850 RepID=A0ABM1BX49_LIMPO|nr:uncharacterized protein LOC106474211 [Limulus polyphemus]